MRYDELVRDNIPEIIKRDGKIPITHIASSKEYHQKLSDKLKEEVNEFLEEGSKKIDELADVMEVIYAICDQENISREDLEKLRIKKAKERGSFKKKIILEEV